MERNDPLLVDATREGDCMSIIPWSIILDPERLRELKSLSILDTPPEQSYDDIAGIVRIVCDTPIANVSLVAEDRQWFKSHIGTELCETPIEQSVCAHALEEDDILVINDLRQDIRTRDNTLVTGAVSLRFYAGVPLRLSTGFGLGTLCALDTKPHPNGLTSAQIVALKALGRQATILLQIRRFLAAQNEHEEGPVRIVNQLEDITNALITAYKLAECYHDKSLEKLIGASLTQLAHWIARMEENRYKSVH